jgi:hypothetical protein
MIWKRKPGKKWWTLAVVMIILITWNVGVGVARGESEILPINPVLGVQVPDLSAMVKIREGTIHLVGDGEIVINDTHRRLAPTVRYLSEFMGSEKSPQEFKAGVDVGFLINDKREVVEIWPIR